MGSLYTINSKSRSAAIDALSRSRKRLYKMNLRALEVMVVGKGKFKMRTLLKSHIGEKIYDEAQIENFLNSIELSFYQRGKLKTAMHIGAMSIH